MFQIKQPPREFASLCFNLYHWARTVFLVSLFMYALKNLKIFPNWTTDDNYYWHIHCHNTLSCAYGDVCIYIYIHIYYVYINIYIVYIYKYIYINKFRVHPYLYTWGRQWSGQKQSKVTVWWKNRYISLRDQYNVNGRMGPLYKNWTISKEYNVKQWHVRPVPWIKAVIASQ